MGEKGFIHDMLDVKLLILYVAARAQYPMTLQQIYEVCFQDDRLSYFDLSIAVPDMVVSGHLSEPQKGMYQITEKGQQQEKVTNDAIAYPVRQRAQAAVEKFNRDTKRRSLVDTEITELESGECTVRMTLKDPHSTLMTLELAAPNRQQARSIAKAFDKNAERVFAQILTELVDDGEEPD